MPNKDSRLPEPRAAPEPADNKTRPRLPGSQLAPVRKKDCTLYGLHLRLLVRF